MLCVWRGRRGSSWEVRVKKDVRDMVGRLVVVNSEYGRWSPGRSIDL